MDLTTNYKMRKPSRGADADPADITDLNYNADTADRVMKETADALLAHTGNRANPHSVTKADVGLAEADNTSDAEKPLSAPQKAYIDEVAAAGFGSGSVTNAMLQKMPAMTLKGNNADIPAAPRDLTAAEAAAMLDKDAVRITAQGSNANGSYIQYADGRMVCKGRAAFSAAITGPSNGQYVTSGQIWSYPKAFTQVDMVVVTPMWNPTKYQWLDATPFGNVDSLAALEYFLVTSLSTTGAVVVRFQVEGRWK